MKINLDVGMLTLLIPNLIALGFFIWRLSQWESRLQLQINQNRYDINNGLDSVRNDMKTRDRYINIRLNTLVAFVEKNYDYHPPTMDDFE